MKIDIQIRDATPEEAQKILQVGGNGLLASGENARGTRYSDEETQLIHDAPDVPTAWKQYRTKYPKSTRGRGAIRKKWTELHGSQVDEKPTESDPTPAPDKKRRGGRVSKLHIPAAPGSPEYQRAQKLCKKYNLPYPEALKKQQQEEATGPVKTPAPAPAKTLDTVSPNDIVTGLKVRQIKPDGGREKMFGVGIVTARKAGGLIEVRDGNGKKHTLDARCLEIDTTGQQASDRATGASS